VTAHGGPLPKIPVTARAYLGATQPCGEIPDDRIRRLERRRSPAPHWSNRSIGLRSLSHGRSRGGGRETLAGHRLTAPILGLPNACSRPRCGHAGDRRRGRRVAATPAGEHAGFEDRMGVGHKGPGGLRGEVFHLARIRAMCVGVAGAGSARRRTEGVVVRHSVGCAFREGGARGNRPGSCWPHPSATPRRSSRAPARASWPPDGQATDTSGGNLAVAIKHIVDDLFPLGPNIAWGGTGSASASGSDGSF
jgi:hypothetical protein